MRLNSLSIYQWSSSAKLEATATFSDEGGEVKLRLKPELAIEILGLCTDSIVAAVQEASKITVDDLKGQLLEHTPEEAE